MKVLGASVLAMESLVLGFALLLAGKSQSSPVIIFGGVVAVLCMTLAGTLRRKWAWVVGSVLQIVLFAYGFFVTPMFFLGALFGGLWIAAIVVGRKGEAARAALLKAGVSKPQ